jgi:hypothetical protein
MRFNNDNGNARLPERSAGRLAERNRLAQPAGKHH